MKRFLFKVLILVAAVGLFPLSTAFAGGKCAVKKCGQGHRGYCRFGG